MYVMVFKNGIPIFVKRVKIKLPTIIFNIYPSVLMAYAFYICTTRAHEENNNEMTETNNKNNKKYKIKKIKTYFV